MQYGMKTLSEFVLSDLFHICTVKFLIYQFGTLGPGSKLGTLRGEQKVKTAKSCMKTTNEFSVLVQLKYRIYKVVGGSITFCVPVAS